jgi:hypothetical protein
MRKYSNRKNKRRNKTNNGDGEKKKIIDAKKALHTVLIQRNSERPWAM